MIMISGGLSAASAPWAAAGPPAAAVTVAPTAPGSGRRPLSQVTSSSLPRNLLSEYRLGRGWPRPGSETGPRSKRPEPQ